MKTCRKCKIEKPLADFRRKARNLDGLDWKCRLCVREQAKSQPWYQSLDRRSKRLWDKFRITVEQYEEMLAAQGGVCRICSGTERDEFRLLAVDHDHVTGKVRGLLCTKCNVAIGLLDDDPDRAMALALYLEHHRKQ